MFRRLLPLLLLAAAVSAQEPAMNSGLRDETFTYTGPDEPVIWRAFETGEPADAVHVVDEATLEAAHGKVDWTDGWQLRHPGWTPALLNAVGKPPDLTLDPQMTDPCDIHLGLRSVNPTMTFGIKLSSEPEFTLITAPAATATHHFDFEFHWKAEAPMAGEKIVIHALGKPVYLQYLKFVPIRSVKQTARVPAERMTVLNEAGRHFAFPGICERADGELLVVCREGDAHVCPMGRIVLTRSRDGGKTWSPREVVRDSPSDERDPAILSLPDGTLVVSCNTWDSWRGSPYLRQKYPDQTATMEKDGWGKYSGCWLLISTDDGKTWSEARMAPTFSPHGPVPGLDGALYWVGLEGRDGLSVVAIHRTADLGKTWTRFSEVAYSRAYAEPMDFEWWDEPNLIFLPGGRAICTIRVDVDGFVRQAYSADGGKTWGWPRKLKAWGYPQQLCRLSDGRLGMAYGYRRPPFGVRACTSADEGRTWDLDHEVVLRAEGGGGDLGYPYSIQLRDGRVMTVYYYNHQGGDCYLEAVAYRP
ncbi:MAG: exo-alpha-sialidase [Armatimonadetes bacterium]|nr:exo-alpha-sialidase [Armatimonadota bacterium]